jgi:hypothetical protein
MHEEIQTLELHDAELTRNVLLARTGLLPNYDAVAQTSEELAQDSDALRQETETISDTAAQARLEQRVAALATALQEKRSAVEDFKSDNAVLRNSLLYLTHAPEHRSGQGEAEAADVWSRLAPMVLRYFQLSEPRRRGTAVLDSCRRLRQMGRSKRWCDISAVVTLLPYVDTVVQIVDAPTPQLVGHCRTPSNDMRRRLRPAQVFRLSLYLVAVTLVGYR